MKLTLVPLWQANHVQPPGNTWTNSHEKLCHTPALFPNAPLAQLSDHLMWEHGLGLCHAKPRLRQKPEFCPQFLAFNNLAKSTHSRAALAEPKPITILQPHHQACCRLRSSTPPATSKEAQANNLADHKPYFPCSHQDTQSSPGTPWPHPCHCH